MASKIIVYYIDVNEYINDKTAVLSPSTINGYVKMKKYYQTIGRKRVNALTTSDIQKFISELSRSGLSPKTVRNAYGLLISAINYFQPDLTFKVTLPAKQKGVRFHDLRHYFASTAAVLQIPDTYLADMGGWSRAGNAPIMKSVYQNNITSMSDYYANKMENHLKNIERHAT
ncbi:MAG: site-specific integrase [Lachnospiraceae bacterium]|nr:site-specific integrase [Lachnospiraceae bacterium]